MTQKNNLQTTLKYILLGLLSAVVLLPVYYLIVTTFKTSAEAAGAPMALPESFDFKGYINAFEMNEYR